MVSTLIAGLVLSTIAGILSAIGFIPQTVKALITRSTAGVSILLALLGMIASIMWVIWGALASAYAPLTSTGPNPLGPGVASAQTAAPIWTNALVIIWTATLLFAKTWNIVQAKRMNLSEAQYCALKANESYEKYKKSNSAFGKWVAKTTKETIVEKEEEEEGNK